MCHFFERGRCLKVWNDAIWSKILENIRICVDNIRSYTLIHKQKQQSAILLSHDLFENPYSATNVSQCRNQLSEVRLDPMSL